MAKSLSRFIVATFLHSAIAASVVGIAEAQGVALSVAQHSGLKRRISSAEVDQIFAKINVFLATDSCEFRLSRAGAIELFNDDQGPLVINSAEDFERLRNVPQDVRIVGEINYCSGTYQLAIAGCSDVGGQLMTVRRFSKTLEPIIWAHEFGHTTGLQHRGDPKALMSPEALAINTIVSGDECATFHRRETVGAPTIAQTQPLNNLSVARQNMSFDDFIESNWPEGVPYTIARSFSRTPIAEITAVLNDRTKEAGWRNAVAVLGAMGSRVAAKALIDFVATRRGELSDPEYLAVSSVPVALGWSIGTSLENQKEPDSGLLLTLIRMSNHEYWRSSIKRNWSAPIYRAQRRLYDAMAIKGLIGLSLTGTEIAAVRLQSVQHSLAKTSASGTLATARSSGRDARAASQAAANISMRTIGALRRGGGDRLLLELSKQRDEVERRHGISAYYR